MPREICTCGHTDEDHLETISEFPFDPRPPGYRITLVGESGHGMCMKCDCARFTWAGWTPEFKEELKKGKRGWSPPESESGLKEREGKNEMNLDYAIEKFHNAVHVLATSPAALKTRLLYAFLSFHTIEAPDLPPELRDDFEWVENALTRLPEEIKGEGMVKATLRRMKEEEAIEVAQRIARIYDGLVKPWERRWSGEEE